MPGGEARPPGRRRSSSRAGGSSSHRGLALAPGRTPLTCQDVIPIPLEPRNYAERRTRPGPGEVSAAFFTSRCPWVIDRNFPGAPRIQRMLATGTHVLIRVKSDIPLRRTGGFAPDGSDLAQISGSGVTLTVRVIEYTVAVAGRDAPQMFCLITDLGERWSSHGRPPAPPRRSPSPRATAGAPASASIRARSPSPTPAAPSSPLPGPGRPPPACPPSHRQPAVHPGAPGPPPRGRRPRPPP